MDHKQQTDAFYNDLKSLVDRYRAEFDLTLSTAIGCLEILKLEIYNEQEK